MQRATRLIPAMKLLGVVAALVCWSSAFPTAAAQQGQDAVYNSSGQVTNSPSFIDASTFAQKGVDFCKVLNGVLSSNSYPATGAVIDARGLPGTTPPTSMTCSMSPWGSGSSYVNVPSTILLPATGGATPNPIIIPNSSPWILPSNTHLIGEGDGIPSSGFTPATTIQAASGFSGSVIQFGPSATQCFPPGEGTTCSGISVEHLTLDGQGQSINGIVNQFASDPSYVDHVSLYQIRGTGLLVSAANSFNAPFESGPYSNITFDTGNYAGLAKTVCAQLLGLSGTRGIHGLSCNSETTDANAAVLLDSSNNSIEDVRIVGFWDGIRVGANANAQSNVLFNIVGDTTGNPFGPRGSGGFRDCYAKA